MKNIIYLFVVLALVIAVSCAPSSSPVIPPNPMTELENLVERIEENHVAFTGSDWDFVEEELCRIDDLLDEEMLTDEEREKVGRLKGRATGYITKAALEIMKSDLEDIGRELKGGIEEFLKVIAE